MSFYKEYRKYLFGNVPSPWWLLYKGYYQLRYNSTPDFTDTCSINKALLGWIWFAFWRGGGKILKVWMVVAATLFVFLSYFHSFFVTYFLVIVFAVMALILFLGLIMLTIFFATDYTGVGDKAREVVGNIWRFTHADDLWNWFATAKIWKIPVWAMMLILIDIPLYYFSLQLPFLIGYLTLINIMLLTPLGKKVLNYFFSTSAGKSVAHIADVGNDLYTTVKDRLCLPAKWV